MTTAPNTALKTSPKIEIRLRIASVMILLGLACELVTLAWSHPIAFMSFMVIGGALVTLGVGLFLFSLVSHS